MASSSAAAPSRRSVFDAAYIRSEFSAAGISAHFIPIIWKYASLRHNPARLVPFLSMSPCFFFFFVLPKGGFSFRAQIRASDP